MMIFVRAIIVFCLYVAATRAQDLRVMENLLHRIEALEEQGVLQQHRIDQQDKLLGEHEDNLKEYVDKRLDEFEDKLKEYVDKRVDEYEDTRQEDCGNKRLEGYLDKRLNEHMDKILENHEDALKGYVAKHLEVHVDKFLENHKDVVKGYVDKLLDKYRSALKKTDFKRPTGRNSSEENLNLTALDNHGPIVKTLRNSNMQERDERPRLVMDNAEGPVAFHATYDEKISPTIGMNQHLIFEDVHLNLGNAFHQLHGLFIAPRPGVYIFSTSVMGAPSTTALIATIMKNGENLANAYAHDGNFNQGSVTAVAQLNVGDEVWVSSTKHQTATVYGEMFTSFMGCLIA